MNIHPPLSAFPIVITTMLVVVEVLRFIVIKRAPESNTRSTLNAASLVLLIALTLAFPCTYLSGYIGAEYALGTGATHRVNSDTIETHRLAAQFALFAVVPMVLLGYVSRIKPTFALHTAYLATLLSFWALVGFVSYLGGNLVFSHGAGVYIDLTP